MEGIQFVVDEEGRRTGVLIDLTRHAELWEDFVDAWLARLREDERWEELEAIEAFDRAQASGEEPIPFEEAVRRIDSSR